MSTTSTDYVAWTDSATGFVIEYSLPVFYELEFTVGEGFRRIPHGGVETGALLIGGRTPSGIRIDSFRPIECEHASGPSFQLSENDLAKLREQIGANPRTTDAESGAVLGWCIAHTRSELVLNERERQLFDELFPYPRALTIIAKPEKFKPTRFAFFVRDDSGAVSLEPVENALVLPAPPRSPRRSDRNREAASVPSFQGEPPLREFTPIVELNPISTPEEGPVAAPPSVFEAPPAVEETTSRSEPVATSSGPAVQHTPVTTAPVFTPRPSRAFAVSQGASRSGAAAAMIVAAILLFAFAIYGFWLRLAPESIPLTLTLRGNTMVVSWPAAATRDADAAEIQVNSGGAVPLAAADKSSGTYALKESGGDIRVEIFVHHWYGTSRGIVRFLASPVSVTAPAVKPASPQSVGRRPASGRVAPVP